MKAYLIQRANFILNEAKKGIDSILRFDYMGSAEFEWGALPKSLERIRENINDYVYLTINVYNKSIRVYCKASQQDEVEEYLQNLAKNKFRLKEYSGFNTYIDDDCLLKSYTDFWWDIKNDLMFWKDDKEFNSKFERLIVGK